MALGDPLCTNPSQPDEFVSDLVNLLRNGTQWNHELLVLTWDTGDCPSSGCSNANTNGGGEVPTILIAPSAIAPSNGKGDLLSLGRYWNHYSTFASMEQVFDLPGLSTNDTAYPTFGASTNTTSDIPLEELSGTSAGWTGVSFGADTTYYNYTSSSSKSIELTFNTTKYDELVYIVAGSTSSSASLSLAVSDSQKAITTFHPRVKYYGFTNYPDLYAWWAVLQNPVKNDHLTVKSSGNVSSYLNIGVFSVSGEDPFGPFDAKQVGELKTITPFSGNSSTLPSGKVYYESTQGYQLPLGYVVAGTSSSGPSISAYSGFTMLGSPKNNDGTSTSVEKANSWSNGSVTFKFNCSPKENWFLVGDYALESGAAN